MEMAKYILTILRSNVSVVLSWGFHDPSAIANGLSFFVCGFIYSGKVEVVYDHGKDLFIVRIFNDDGSIKEQVDDVYFDDLVDTIDEIVEKCADYDKRVEVEYKF
jgi:hypothetical protein